MVGGKLNIIKMERTKIMFEKLFLVLAVFIIVLFLHELAEAVNTRETLLIILSTISITLLTLYIRYNIFKSKS